MCENEALVVDLKRFPGPNRQPPTRQPSMPTSRTANVTQEPVLTPVRPAEKGTGITDFETWPTSPCTSSRTPLPVPGPAAGATGSMRGYPAILRPAA